MILALGLSKLVLSPSSDNSDAVKWQHPTLEPWLERAQPPGGELQSHETLPIPAVLMPVSGRTAVTAQCFLGIRFQSNF